MPAGISALGKHLARELNVRNAAKVTAIEPESGSLHLTVEQGESTKSLRVSRNLILTAPIPQALELLAALTPDWPEIEEPPYREAIVAMVRVDPARLPEGPAVQKAPTGGGTVIRDYMKFADVEPGVSFRFSAEQSRDLFEESEGEIVEATLDLIEPLTGVIPAGVIQLMKWRYANGAGTVSQPYLETVADGVNVRVCGDAFHAGEADGTEASLQSCRSALESLA